MTEHELLKLAARDVEDLAVIAAVAQDALVPIGELAFLQAERRFVMVLNRFRWDRINRDQVRQRRAARAQTPPGRDVPFWDASDRPPYERTLAGLRFENVSQVKTRGIDLRHRDRILELLTIRAEAGEVLLVFAGDAVIRLESVEIQCFLEDFGASWPTRYLPSHPDEKVDAATK